MGCRCTVAGLALLLPGVREPYTYASIADVKPEALVPV
jgi:hypothetical protein